MALSLASNLGASTVFVLTRIIPDARLRGTLPTAQFLAVALGTPTSLAARSGAPPEQTQHLRDRVPVVHADFRSGPASSRSNFLSAVPN